MDSKHSKFYKKLSVRAWTTIFKIVFSISCKLLKLNFIEYCTSDTMHYLIYGNFGQVYACWKVTDFVYKKMLECCSQKTPARKE